MTIKQFIAPILVTIVMTGFFTSFISIAQINPVSSALVKPQGCELNSSILDNADQWAGEDTIMILVGFVGEKDTNKKFLKRRLLTVKNYLTKLKKSRNNSNLIISELLNGDTRKWGGVDVYVKGNLYGTLDAYPNADLPLHICDDSNDELTRNNRKLLYPWAY